MEWSKEKPSLPGWYWYREGDAPIYKFKMLEISGAPADRRIGDFGFLKEQRWLRQYNGEWYGPLEPPGDRN